MNPDFILLISLLLPLLGFQGLLVILVVRSLPLIFRKWQEDAGGTSNVLLNEAEQLKLLDRRFFASGPYEALRRLGISSPLFGVAATAILILTKQSDSGKVTADSLSDLKLLFSGVLGGAIMAITNQICMWYVNHWFQEQRNSVTLSPESNNLFRNVNEFRAHLTAAVTDATERSALLITSLNQVILSHNECLIENIGSIRSLHDDVMKTIEGASDQTESLSSFAKGLAESNVALGKLNDKENGLPKFLDEIKRITTTSSELAVKVTSLDTTIKNANTKMGEAAEKIEKGADSLGTASKSFQKAAEEIEKLSTAVAEKWDTFATDFDDIAKNKLTPKLQEIVSDFGEQTKASKEAAKVTAQAATNLQVTLDLLGRKVGAVKGVSDDVSAGVTAAMKELKEAVQTVRASIESQKGMLVNWKQVLDQMPASYQARANQVLQAMIADLSTLMEHVHGIVDLTEKK